MFYTGETPWHNLGVKLPANATWEQARDAAGFYDVIERPVFAQGLATQLPDVKALIASDDGRYLSTVGMDYGVVQLSQLAKAVEVAIGKVDGLCVGGLLGNLGQKGWLLGEIGGDPLVVKGGDEIRKYFLAYAGHDGRTPITFANCSTRTVCKNTIAIALAEKGGFRTTIRHTSNAVTYVDQAAKAFQVIRESYGKVGAWANRAADRRLSGPELRSIIEAVHPTPVADPKGSNQRQIDRVDAIHGKILDLYENHEVPSTKGTAWAAFNAIQGFAEHFAPTRARLQLGAMTDTARAAMIAERGFFGAGAEGGQEALAAVCSVANLPHPSMMQAAA